MKRSDEELQRKFEVFGEMLEGDAGRYSEKSFEEICGILGVRPGAFDRFIFSQVGITGKEVLELYRNIAFEL